MRSITFISKDTQSYIDELQCRLTQTNRPKTICLYPLNQQAIEIYDQLKQLDLLKGVELYGIHATQESTEIKAPGENFSADLTIILCDKNTRVSDALLSYLDLKQGEIVAPIISVNSSFHPLFLISIPKAGTHLLYKLAEQLGYTSGIECPEKPDPQNWYCIQGTNSHTEAKDFLLESSKQHYFANRNHPFTHSPALFIYRHPLDILVSEANYYHKSGNTVYSSYLNHLNFEERLLKLANDPILLGSIRERLIAFAAWLEFENVIPISFEELIGAQGGGCDIAQSNLIWSLLLKLHISGDPDLIASKVFNKESATFHKGQIGTYPEHLTPEVETILSQMPQDYLELFGYQHISCEKNILDYEQTHSTRIDEFRARPLIVSPPLFDDLPVCAEYGYREHNIIKFKGKYFAVSLTEGSKDLSDMSQAELDDLINDERIQTVKRLITKKISN